MTIQPWDDINQLMCWACEVPVSGVLLARGHQSAILSGLDGVVSPMLVDETHDHIFRGLCVNDWLSSIACLRLIE